MDSVVAEWVQIIFRIAMLMGGCETTMAAEVAAEGPGSRWQPQGLPNANGRATELPATPTRFPPFTSLSPSPSAIITPPPSSSFPLHYFFSDCLRYCQTRWTWSYLLNEPHSILTPRGPAYLVNDLGIYIPYYSYPPHSQADAGTSEQQHNCY